MADNQPWKWDTDSVYRALRTTSNGLSKEQALLRHRASGANELPRERDTALKILLRQIKSPLLLILLFAAIASYFLAQPATAITISSMMGLSVLLGFTNEYRSENLIEHLHAHISPTTSVIRGGKITEVLVREVTLGDVISLLPGTIVPADMRLVDAEGLELNESVLSGESAPQLKHARAINKVEGGIRENCAYQATHVASGHGLGVVYAIGKDTEFGRITGTIARIRPEAEFTQGIRQFGLFLVRLVSMIALAIFIINISLHRPLIDALLFTLAIAIGLTPELLPAIVSVSMAHGAAVLARKRVLVKHLVAIEDLGNIDVICTDKTGTLTEGVLRVTDYYDVELRHDPILATHALWSIEPARAHHAITSPYDVAMLRFRHDQKIAVPKVRYTAALPFDFNRRRASKLVQSGSGLTLICRGAPEPVLQACSRWRQGLRSVPLNHTMRQQILKDFTAKSELGLRIVAFASKITTKTSISVDDEAELTFDGFVVFEDHIKHSAANAIARLQAQGVRLCVVSGDHELVCRHVCEGLMETKDILTGDHLNSLSDQQLGRAVRTVDIFARVTPEQKVRIIRAFKRIHKVVGFVGDGINDAPALHEADVGISVSTAVDVARDAANVVLLKSDLRVIADGIWQGRRIFNNTIKYIFMGTSSNFGNMISAAIGSFFLPFLPMLPVQILLTNVLYDVSQLSIPTDNVDDEDLQRPRHWDVDSIKRFMFIFGPVSSVYDLITFAVMVFLLKASVDLFHTGWFIESLITQTLVVFVFRTRRIPFFSSRPSWMLLLSALAIVILGILIPMTKIGSVFQFTPVPYTYLGIFIIMAITYLFFIDILKGATDKFLHTRSVVKTHA